MTLVFTLVGVLVATTALFMSLAYTLQGYLYSEPADKLPLRAVIAGLLVAMMMTGWTYANTRASHKDKYGVLHEATPGEQHTISEFEAVRRYNIKQLDGTWKEETVKFTRTPSSDTFYEAGDTTKPFDPSKSGYIYPALIIKDGDEKIRLETPITEKWTYEDQTKTYREPDGKRYLEGTDPRFLVVPDAGAYTVMLLLNAGLIIVWFVAFWPVMRFSVGHSLGLMTIFAGVSLFVVMPLLFNSNAISK